MVVSGKNAGKYVVVVDRVAGEKNFVIVEGKGVKRHKMNSAHVEPLPKIINIKKNSKSEEIIKELEKEGFK